MVAGQQLGTANGLSLISFKGGPGRVKVTFGFPRDPIAAACNECAFTQLQKDRSIIAKDIKAVSERADMYRKVACGTAGPVGSVVTCAYTFTKTQVGAQWTFKIDVKDVSASRAGEQSSQTEGGWNSTQFKVVPDNEPGLHAGDIVEVTPRLVKYEYSGGTFGGLGNKVAGYLNGDNPDHGTIELPYGVNYFKSNGPHIAPLK